MKVTSKTCEISLRKSKYNASNTHSNSAVVANGRVFFCTDLAI